LSALVTRFLDFARPLHADLTPQSITAVLDRALVDAATVWKGEPVRVEKNYEANLPPVAIDESLCEQAFLNIVQNAYDAMSTTGGVLKVSAAKSQVEGREGVEVRLADTGPGIPAELREQIFNPFVTTKKTGVGLGLSIVSKIMDGHRGLIRVEDASDKGMAGAGTTGACFVLFFPAASEEDAVGATAHLVIS
jgi:nitrogen-specific signal transduction histidine kinase